MGTHTKSIEICNLALLRAGLNLINDFTDKTKEAKTCGLLFPQVLNSMLSQFNWNFARTEVILSKTVNPNPKVPDENPSDTSPGDLNVSRARLYGLGYGIGGRGVYDSPSLHSNYQLNAFLRPLDLMKLEAVYTPEGGRIKHITEDNLYIYAPTEKIRLQYISANILLAPVASLFIDALSLELAARLGSALRLDMNLIEQIKKEAMIAMRIAVGSCTTGIKTSDM